MTSIDSKVLRILQRDSEWLSYLEAAGVDNWEGYEVAQQKASEDGWYGDEDD
jgi:hypothetical protein